MNTRNLHLFTGALLFILLSGCAEKSDVVIRKTEAIPEEAVFSETELSEATAIETPAQKIPARPAQHKPVVTKPAGNETPTTPETGLVENPATNPVLQENDPPVDPPAFVAIPGECIVYTIRWNFARIGKLLLACKKEKVGSSDVYHLVGITLPEGLMTKVGYGYNRFDSYVDAKTNLPFYYYGYYSGSNSSQVTKTRINQQTKVLTFETKKYRNNAMYSTRTESVKFSGNLYDGLSVFYAVRGADLANTSYFTLPVGITKVWNLRVSVLEKGTKKFAAVGTRNYLLLRTDGDEDQGIFKSGKLLVGISNDKDRLPLFFRGSVPLGTANIDIAARFILGNNVSFDSKTLTQILISSTPDS